MSGPSQSPRPPGAASPAGEDATPLVVGLDLSMTGTGVCTPDGETSTIRTRPQDGDVRLTHIVDEIRDLNCGFPAAAYVAVIEDLPTHAKSAGITGMVHGAVRHYLQGRGVPYVLVTPATLKKYATGRGNADKTAMAIAALKRGNREFADDNQVDAWWLYAAALDHYGAPLFSVPQSHRDALAKVAWPELSHQPPTPGA